jgi:DNA-binding NtrC family response regulator
MRILVVDDEIIQRETLGAILSDHDYTVITASGFAEAELLVRRKGFDVVLTDFRMPDGTGLQLSQIVREIAPESSIFIMTAYADVQSVIESMRLGVVDYILKPIHVEALLKKLNVLKENKKITEELKELRTRLSRTEAVGLLGESQAIGQVRAVIKQVSLTKGTVLISGESGTGKEVAARLIHAQSSQSQRPFVAINCAAIPENLLESELFGHKKGSFTGAVSDKDGIFRQAHTGTLFLDEIGELPKNLQAKLLRVIQEREVTAIGDTRSVKIDVRIIVATNRNLESDVKVGLFRQDLFYRINVVQIVMPPLREHADDVPILVRYFLAKYAREFRKRHYNVSNDAMRVLMEYNWPGNVRELENVIERAIILGPVDGLLGVEHLPTNLQILHSQMTGSGFDSKKLDDVVAAFSRKHIQNILEKCKGDKKEAARILGLSLSSLYRKLEDYALTCRQDLSP